MQHENGPPTTSPADSVTRALEEYLAAAEAGTAPPRKEFLARYPELADDLDACLAALRFIGRAAGGPRSLAAEAAAAEVPEQAPGQLGDFRLIREVGRGGMGIVYEAEQISLGRRVALKMLPFAATMDPRHLQRFHNEARAAASLHHTSIVPVYAVGQERAVHFYAMQFIDGRTLAEFISQQRGEALRHVPTIAQVVTDATEDSAAQASSAAPRDAAYFRRVAEWAIQAAEGLEHAHQLGVVHRDVKPANLMVDAAGRLWVTDFGLAQVQSDARLTITGDLVGTLRYMSPEQALARRVLLDHRTDVYSLGATLYELLTLEPAFGGGDRQELLRQIAFEEPKTPRRVNRAIPAELETIVLKALEKNPAERYATAQELADDLRRWLDDKPIRARRAGLVQRLRKLTRRHRAAAAAAAVCLLVVLVAGGGSAGWVLSDQAARRRDAAFRVQEAEAKVRAALKAAEPGLRDGNPWAPPLTSALEVAEGQLDGGTVAPELQGRVRQLQKDVRMVLDLDTFRLNERDILGSVGTTSLPPIRNPERRIQLSEAFARRFRDYGIDVEVLPTAEAAALVQASAIREHLVRGLDDWVQMMGADEKTAGTRRQVLAVARQVDPDWWRDRLRDLVLSGELGGLDKVAQSARAEELPAPTLRLLVRLVEWSGDQVSEPMLDLLRRAHQRFPADFWINHDLALALSRSPNRESRQEAVGFFRAAVALRPQDFDLRIKFATVLRRGEKFAEAEVIYCQSVARDPTNASSHQLLGDVLLEEGRPASAEAAYRRVFDLTLTHGAWWKVREALLKQGKPKSAVLAEEEAAYRKAIELHPDPHSGLHLFLGDILLAHGEPAGAEVEYRKSLESGIPTRRVWRGLRNALVNQGKPVEATLAQEEAAYRKQIERNPNIDLVHNEWGVALFDRGRPAEAEPEFREAIRLEPLWILPHSNLGDALGRYDDALEVYSEAIRMQPEYGELWVDRGWAYADLGQWDKASADIVKATQCKLPPARASCSAAMLCLRDKNLDGYRKICADMLERFGKGEDEGAAHWAAWTCALAPNSGTDPARLVLLAERASAESPRDHLRATGVGAALFRAGRFPEAVERLTEATALNADPYRSDMIFTRFFLAMAHHRLGHADEARRLFDEGIRAMVEELRRRPSPPEGPIGRTATFAPNSCRKLTLQLLRREAEELIQGTAIRPGR